MSASGYFFSAMYLSPLSTNSRLATSGSFEQDASSAPTDTTTAQRETIRRDIADIPGLERQMSIELTEHRLDEVGCARVGEPLAVTGEADGTHDADERGVRAVAPGRVVHHVD